MATAPVLLLFLLLSVSSPADQSRLRTFHITEKRMNQTEARAACRTNYTDLVTVYSDEDNTALTNLINMTGISLAWIGLIRNQSSDKWSNGDDVTFSNLTGVCGSGSCCVAMKADGSWESLQCTDKRNFMCYKRDADLTLRYHLTSENMSWYEAQSYCRKNYTDLVSIRDQNQNEAVKIEGLTSRTSFWIGLLHDGWEWTDGGRSAYRNWATAQPRSSSVCVRLRKGKWETSPCSNTRPALCYNTLIHVSAEQMDWESALDYCQRENRTAILRIESDLDQKEVKFELRRRRVSGPLWVGLGQSRLSELLKSSSKLALGPWTNRNERQTEPAPLSRAGTDTVEKTFRKKTDVSALRAVCELKQP
ncbi:secretory phospholipase A2 receptor-like isoform X2 [Colossoma macropomum]|uniref:secretory phospholipase A2 receptor-like isoform X2 n=1 Tax=Colossoma macropomum TaxID=42526 RepID=UPI0018646B44|nr:secretory phospholipase A2 receptor-like isoform X2 [Colossoma macropomum]